MNNTPIADIARARGILLTIADESYPESVGMERRDFDRKSYILGGDTQEIVLGFYEREDERVAAFFHEMGHVIDTPPDQFNTEFDAWRVAKQLAHQYGYMWTEEMEAYLHESLGTYE